MLGQEEPLGEEELESCAGEGVGGVKSAAGMSALAGGGVDDKRTCLISSR